MAEKKKSPEIRFAGFTDEWREVELGEILTERNELQKISEDAPILAFASGQGVIDRSERRSNNRDHLTLDQENKIYKLTELEDIVYNPSNLKYGAIDRNKHGRGVISPIYVTFTTKEEPSFIERIVKSEKFKLRALQYEEGTVVKRQSVKPENLLSLKINLPKSKREQKEIGVLFDKLESSIVNHTKKYEKLLKLKKAMLIKMFPQNGATAPEIRFKGFDEKWKSKKLENLGTFLKGSGYSKSDLLKNGIPIILYGRLYTNYTLIIENVETFTKPKEGSLYSEGGEVIIPSSGESSEDIVTASVIKNAQVIIGGDLNVIRPKENLDSTFLALSISNGIMYNELIKKAQGKSVVHIRNSDLQETNLLLPDISEQKKIGQYFEILDRNISKHNSQIAKLKTIKKAFLNKLFLSQD